MTDTRKVVINACFGGFSLSPYAVARRAELQGRPCFFYRHPEGVYDFRSYELCSVDEAAKAFSFYAFDVPDAHTTILRSQDNWQEMTKDEKDASRKLYEEHQHDNRDVPRDDTLLIQVVEELGEKASGSCARLKVVEIPADVEYTVEEYDGNEHIAEAHQTWS